MDELTTYIIKNYTGLLTVFEKAAYKGMDVKDHRVKDLLKNGREAFTICKRKNSATAS
jgi:dihydroxyacetone kinase